VDIHDLNEAELHIYLNLRRMYPHLPNETLLEMAREQAMTDEIVLFYDEGGDYDFE